MWKRAKSRRASSSARSRSTGTLPPETPFCEGDGVDLYADASNAETLAQRQQSNASSAGSAHFARLRSGDYVALLAYIARNAAHDRRAAEGSACVARPRHVATCVGFGPRFLHSTGQAYKGGPNSGVFLQITADDADDVPIPGQPRASAW